MNIKLIRRIPLAIAFLGFGLLSYQRIDQNRKADSIEEIRGLVKQMVEISIGKDGVWVREEKRALLDELGMRNVPLLEKNILTFVPKSTGAEIYNNYSSYNRLEGKVEFSHEHYQGTVSKNILKEYLAHHTR